MTDDSTGDVSRRRARSLRRLGSAAAALFLVSGCVGGAETTSPPTDAPTVGSTPPPESPPMPSRPAQVLSEREDWGAVFETARVTGTFALREVGSDRTDVWDAGRAGERRIPASTFKVLNSMVILETGVLDDVDTAVPWDGTVREIPEWNRPHSLRSGIEVSAVWAYQELARDVGERRMADWVERVGYGNADVGGGIDRFWLSGDLRISPLEQLDFLEQMVERDLPFRREVIDAVADIMVRECGDDWTWSHKTGTALAEEPRLGWLVGTTSHLGREWVFAMNLDLAGDGVDGQIDPQIRQRLAREILVGVGALPEVDV